MELSRHIYQWDKVIIGGDLRSLLYAVAHNCPVIFVEPSPPFQFDVFEEGLDFTRFGFSEDDEPNQLEVWERLMFLCGLLGLLPISSSAESIRIKNDLLVVTTKNLRVVKAEFNKLLVFEPDQIKSLPEVIKSEKKSSKVIDWFNVRYGCRHDIDYILFEDNFIKELYFYPTERSDNKTLKDAVAVSYLKEDEISGFDFSEVMARHKVEHLMNQAEIKGPINGYRNEKPVYLSIKTEHAERQIIPNVKRTFRKDDKFEFLDLEIVDILNQFSPSPYIEKLVGN
jgi:hypothetical protein